MADTVSVMSLAHTAIRIQEPMPEEFQDKPGLAPLLKTAVIAGSSDADPRTAPGITHGVDAGLFKVWHEMQVKMGSALAHLVSIFDPEKGPENGVQFGHEPGLDAAASNSEATEAAAKGSTVTDDGPVSSVDMAATSNTPNDDSPRGDADLVQTARTQDPGTAAAAPDEVVFEPAAEDATTSPEPAAKRGKKASDLDGPVTPAV